MPTGYNVVWTEEMDDTLKRLYPTTLNIDIMRTLGISESTFYRRVKLLGLTKADNYAETYKKEHHRRQCIAERKKTNCPTRIKKGEHKSPATEFKSIPMSDEDKEMHRRIRMEQVYEERVRIKYGLPQKTKIKFKEKYDLTKYTK